MRSSELIDRFLPTAACLTSSRGSRRMRSGPSFDRFTRSPAPGRSSRRRRPSSQQPLVHGTQAPFERGEHRGAERHRFAVHGTAGGHDRRSAKATRLGASTARSGTMKPRRSSSSARCSGVRGRTTVCSPRRRSSTRREHRALELVVEGQRGRGADHVQRAARGPGPARRARPGRARSRPGSTPPSGPGSGAACPWPRSGPAARAGSPRAPTTARARRQLTWCWTFAHS